MDGYVMNRLYLPRDGGGRIADVLGGSGRIDFNAAQPVPAGLTEEERQEWCSAFWGTGSNAANVSFLDTVVTFYTEEAPPLAWLLEVSRLLPQYEFTLDWFYDAMPDWYQCVVRGGKVQYVNGV